MGPLQQHAFRGDTVPNFVAKARLQKQVNRATQIRGNPIRVGLGH